MRGPTLFVSALLALGGCRHQEDAPDPKMGGDGPTPKPAAAAPAVADPGPILSRGTGKRAVEKRPDVVVPVEAWFVEGGAAYAQVGMPERLSDLAAGPENAALIEVKAAGRHGFAVPSGEGRLVDRPLVFVRFDGATPPPDGFTLHWRQASTTDGQPGQRQLLTVKRAADAEQEKELPARFLQAAGRWFQGRGRAGPLRQEAFYTFAGARLSRMAHATGRTAGRLRQGVRSDLSQMMRLYTGMTSVDEALQSDRGLLLRTAEGARDIPLAQVEGLRLPPHPWDRMIAGLPGAPQPIVESLAKSVPEDMLYLHFHDLRTLVRLAEELDQMVTPVGRAVEEQGGPRHLFKRYERQLVLERMGLSKTLGHMAAKGIAIVSSDPLFREGTDVSLLFHMRNQGLLDTALSRYEVRARARRPDIVESTYTVGAHSVRLLSTPDGDVRQHKVVVGELLVVSNSRAALSAILEAHGGQRPRLADSGDFRYFRARFPFDTKAEDGFLFISDAFVAHTVSPRVKILQARRMAAAAELQGIASATLMHGWLTGKRARSYEALIASGVLDPSEKLHSDGSPIEFDAARGPWSASWGRFSEMRPLADSPLEHVSANEKAAYKRFSESYQAYWRGYIDPIGVRIHRSDDGMALEARMMPLIHRSEYNDLAAAVGDKRLVPPKLTDGLRFTLAVAADSSLRRELDRMGQGMTGHRDVGLSWLGDWVMVGLSDRSGLWDMALAGGEVPSVEGPRAFRDSTTRKKVLARAPLYAGVQVRNKLALAGTLTALKSVVGSAAPGVVEWGPSEPHGKVPVVRIKENLSTDEGLEGVALHYATVKDVFLLSLDRATLEAQIDAVLAGRTPKLAKDAKETAQAIIGIRPGAESTWLRKTLLGLLERGMSYGNRAAYRGHEALARGLPGAAVTDEDGLNWLGYVPLTAHGGTIEMKDGAAFNPVYGSEDEPLIPKVPVADSPVSQALSLLDGLQLTLGFEGAGEHRALATTLKWKRRSNTTP
jgi:hypothetical protein